MKTHNNQLVGKDAFIALICIIGDGCRIRRDSFGVGVCLGTFIERDFVGSLSRSDSDRCLRSGEETIEIYEFSATVPDTVSLGVQYNLIVSTTNRDMKENIIPMN